MNDVTTLVDPLLLLRGVRKSFGAATVLDGIDLTVGRGDVITLIGASGSGKSTLLRCINLLEPIDDGRILLDDVDISDPSLDPDPIRRCAAATSARGSETSVPSSSTCPSSISSSRSTHRSSVDLPDPDDPMSVTTWCSSTVRSTPRRTGVVP